MNEELATVLNYMEKERGIDREVLFSALESALLTASRKSVGPARELRVEIDRTTCEIRALATLEVSERVVAPHDQISVARARKVKPDAKPGDMIEVEVTPRNFGRIAAQTAKQAILQTIRQAEKDMVYEEFKDRVGDILTGTVRRFERSDIVVDLGRTEAVMPARERVPTEEYQPGDRIRALLVDVRKHVGGTDIVLSRSHPDFVRRLFEIEVAEIADGTVEIKGIAREAGYRTKIAVVSNEERVDPVGACVGMRGMRVKNIVRELSGEKIDIVRWSEDVRTYVTNALSPAKLLQVGVDQDKEHIVHVVTDADQLSLAIGKRGQNVRLTAKLVGWKIDIQKREEDVSFEEKVSRAISALAAIEGLDREKAEKLVHSGFLSLEGVLAAEIADLEAVTGFDAEAARQIYEAVAAHQAAEIEKSLPGPDAGNDAPQV